MRQSKFVVGLLAILVAAPFAQGSDTKPAEELARLKNALRAAGSVLNDDRMSGTSEEAKKAAIDRYRKAAGAIGRQALALAETYPDAREAVLTLVWMRLSLAYSSETAPVLDATYDLLARRYLDNEAILPVVRIAWGAVPAMSDHAEAFLKAAVERSPDLKIRALACLSLARCQQHLIMAARDFDHPVRGQLLRDWYGPERVRQVRERKPEELKREAKALFERTIKEFADVQPMGKSFPPLGEQARGGLFELCNLEPGCIVPDIDGQDIDGKPMKLSDFRGRVLLISFWAGWCGPCMGMVPDEKTLVERLKSRPFVLVGINGDKDRSQAKEVVAKNGINWRSFWDGGDLAGTAVKWGVSGWPTVYLVDAKGVIRDAGSRIRGADLEKAILELVDEAEAAKKKP